MRGWSRNFPLFQSHLDLAHRYWSALILPGDIAIDATSGNGHDALQLCRLALKKDGGRVYALDIQQAAVAKTEDLLSSELPIELLERVSCLKSDHQNFPDEIIENSVKLIVYNLGYLPGGDKTMTTQTDSTLISLTAALRLLCAGGAISITCYPGHAEGLREENALLEYSQQLPPHTYSCCHHRWLNRKDAPSLLIIQKGSAHPSENASTNAPSCE